MRSQAQAAQVEVEVRYAETDQMGVVHHANYLVWFELARTRLCERTGWHYAEIEKLGTLLMVTGAELRYLKGARYGDRVTIEAVIDRFGSRALRFAYRVLREGDLLVTGATEHVWVDKASGRVMRIPEMLRRPFAALAGEERPAGRID